MKRRAYRIFSIVPVVLLIICAALFAGCGGQLSGSDGIPALKITEGEMIHARQVLTRYDAGGNPIPQYFEIWVAPGKAAARELDENGEAIRMFLDNGDTHIAYNASTKEAVKSDGRQVFMPDFEALKKAYPDETANPGQTYVGRDCTVHLLVNYDSDDDREWVKIYRDDQTGFVLFCDAPMFTLKSASFEMLPEDPERFSKPKGLIFGKEGAR